MHASPWRLDARIGPDALPPPDPRERRAGVEPDDSAFAGPAPAPGAARTLSLPHPTLARLTGSVGPGEVLFLGGAPDFLTAVAHAFLVEAVRERPEGWQGDAPLGRDPRAVVVDGANAVSPYLFAAGARDRGFDAELLLPRVRLARAFTAYQLVALLTQHLEYELAREGAELVVVLGVRELFEDEDLGASEARQLARQASEGFRSAGVRQRVPCLVTSPAPADVPRARSLERIVAHAATRVVRDLRFEAAPGVGRARTRPAASLEAGERRLTPDQRPLEEWGEMPERLRLVGVPGGGERGEARIAAHWRPKRGNARKRGMIPKDDKVTSRGREVGNGAAAPPG